MYNSNEEELEILKYWEEHKCFEKSVSQRPENKPYVFYDGPPFATGLPHYGHILSSVIKDVVPRYWTMKGYKVRRRWGWDCHGLPIENLIEKELKISGKKQIEEKLGVDKFNEACRSKVLMYTKEWKKMIERIGRWVEFDNAYKTMDPTYMESVWWALKTVWDKGLIYEGRKVLMYCPHCETPVSKAEVAMDNSYQDIIEETVIAKFKIKNPEGHNLPENTYILAWTTTPWTLPGNVALAVGDNIGYVVAETEKSGQKFIAAADRAEAIFGKNYKVLKGLRGSDLVGVEYEPLYDIPAARESGKQAWYVTPADFVTTIEGTGVVHTAVVYGEDDYNLGVKIGLPVVPLLDEAGRFNGAAPELIRGQYFKDTEKIIKQDLESRGLIFSREQHTHSYPHCWRCGTQLYYNAISAWFIDIQSVKKRMLELNEKINWYPEHLKHGRFRNILETAPDWNISRNRYWATPLPFWKCGNKECGHAECVGSVEELKTKATNFGEVYKTDKIEEMDLHKHLADKIKLKCEKCGGTMTRIPEVIDCWVESGSMPFAELHYPFENQKTFEHRFPGQYIAEYIAQTRAWFYYMHSLAVLLFDNISFENCVTTGTILNEKGEKLSKSKMNYTDPWVIIEKYGVDALRFYLMTSVVMEADNLFFSDNEVKDTYNKVINILWNVVTFYQMYALQKSVPEKISPKNVLDKWILSKLEVLIKEVTVNMDNYNTVKAGRPIKDFVNDLSTWYVRRSRDRFKGDNGADKDAAVATLGFVLLNLSKIMAPFMPFIAEKIYLALGGKEESVHLDNWPEANGKLINKKVMDEMDLARKVVEVGLAIRAEKGIKVRQPLARMVVSEPLPKELYEIISDEMNVKKTETGRIKEGETFVIKEDTGVKVGLDIALTEELKKEGLVREVVRTVNQMRKDKKLTINDAVVLKYSTSDDVLNSVFFDYTDEIKKSVLADRIEKGDGSDEFEIGGGKVKLSVEKVG